MRSLIHSTAVVDRDAQLGQDCAVGPYAVIGANVTLGARCSIGSHACLDGPLVMGDDNQVGAFAMIGSPPQIKGKNGPWGSVRIGARNVIREYATVHRAGTPEGMTSLGDDSYLMAGAHMGHDALVGHRVVICNNSLLGGHVRVDDGTFLSANVAVHQFTRIGGLTMIGGFAAVNRDVAPFALVTGTRPVRLHGMNVVGVRRAGVDSETRLCIKVAYRQIFRGDGSIAERLSHVEISCPEVARLVEFIRLSKRGVIGLGGAPTPRMAYSNEPAD